jgi:Spy/CpxP family protein refolding chaperone
MTLRIAIIAAALALTALITPVRAQDPQMQAEVAAFQKSLAITPAQKTKLDAIGKKYQSKMQAVQQKYQKLAGPKPDASKQQSLMQNFQKEVKPLADAMRKESEAILTPAQRTKVKAFEAKMRAKMGGGPKG